MRGVKRRRQGTARRNGGTAWRMPDACSRPIRINRALDAIWKVVADANRYFAAQAPWALKKTDPARMETVLYVTAEVLRQVGILIQPYMPASAGKLLDLLSVPVDARMFSSLKGPLVSGGQLPPPAPVFPRYVEKEEEPA